MDAEDTRRTQKHLQKLLTVLQDRRRLTNHQVREIAGSRGMGRLNELQKLGHDIAVTKRDKSTWDITYVGPPQPRREPTPQGLFT